MRIQQPEQQRRSFIPSSLRGLFWGASFLLSYPTLTLLNTPFRTPHRHKHKQAIKIHSANGGAADDEARHQQPFAYP